MFMRNNDNGDGLCESENLIAKIVFANLLKSPSTEQYTSKRLKGVWEIK